MFEDVATADLLGHVRAHDFAGEPTLEVDAVRVDAIRELDRTIRAAQAEQVRQVALLHRERARKMGLGHGDPTLSVIGEVSMARMIGPTAAGTQVELALGMTRLPKVFDLFLTGAISEATARAVARETQSLHVDDDVVADGEIAAKITGMTTAQARDAAARVVIGIDAEAAHERARRNRADARVTLHPDADGIAHLRVRGPAEQIVAAHRALDDWATGLRSTGDPRSRGQIMTGTLVERVTGQAFADDVAVEINLVLDAKTLVAGGDTPVELDGYGPISPDVADEIIAKARTASIRRLFVDPADGTLLVREPRRRRFTRTTSAHIRTRDRRCRQPGCDAKIRHDDHIHAFEHGGLSVADNGQGLCVRSHTIKHQPGWTITTTGTTTTWNTPTGHQYRSTPPPVLPGRDPGHQRQ
ncbi:HNH endonuclease signature motif containing protein [Aeromicrobium stalagmiti]|uniref:HNH endonuclease signature motif containing protein n=1 Tax=Aeromicrobium stalagmiti TaxID=2738988 RepID=UPI00156807EE|nr:HNH endonuclease signature motif containing protein [Aeromicrobium stalagmiti]NRQ49878.1 HNH endonuclease [Aeromicrobium stalagmiti]